ncbi:MAG: hypothetical protein ACRDLM_09595 [Gaiellaceae bacterium]
MSTETIERRLREFVAETDELDWQDVLHRAEAPRRFPRRRLAFALAACVAIAALAAYFTGAFTPSSPRTVNRLPMGYDPLALDFTRNAQQVASINVTVNAAIPDGTLRLQVLRSDASQPLQAMQAEGDSSVDHVVFEEQVPMTNIASPATGPGSVALSTWSGSLLPSDWNDGCQNALYTIQTVVVPSGGSFDNLADGSETTTARWFTCDPG